MERSEITYHLECLLDAYTWRTRLCSCWEVTFNFGSLNERVDFLTLDHRNTWRFYEIKSCKADFYSNAKHTFYGHLNYYVMPYAVYCEVKDDIANHIGVLCEQNETQYTQNGYKYIELIAVKKAKRQELRFDDRKLMLSILRSKERDSIAKTTYEMQHDKSWVQRDLAKTFEEYQKLENIQLNVSDFSERN